ncbi:MAG: hypothetical protein EPN82_08890 [Bacteroidetes bacterium]|nr:MAG: hypothetical protein EPN82_08890 [Bacteroidota bacterium]
MIINKIYIILIIIFAAVNANGQNPMYSIGPWNFNSINGSVSVEGSYRQQTDKLESDFRELMKSSAFRSFIKLNANSYVWHPNFMTLDADMEYSPNAHIDNFLVIPNRTESNTAERINVNISLLNSLPVTVGLFGGAGHSYTSRDFATDVELKSTNLGGKLAIKNSILPLNISAQRSEWGETELATGRRYFYDDRSFTGTLSRSFGSFSDNQLNFNYDDIKSDYSGGGTLETKIAHTTMSNRIGFTSDGKTEFNSFLSYLNSVGAQQANRIDENATLKLLLPENFLLTATYLYANVLQDNLSITQHNPILKIEHQLFLSLHTFGYYQYSNMDVKTYKENRNIAGLGFNYEKIITPGMLYINYEFIGLNEKRTSTSAPIIVRNEEYTLEDGKVLLLKNPYVRQGTIVVKNNNGTVIFRENIDFILIKRGDFIEIQRLPGGQIANRSNVYIDYEAESQSSYHFNSFSHVFETRVSLLDKVLDIYVKVLENNFGDVYTPETKILKISHQKVAGLEVRKGVFTGGAEADFYNSNVVPYNSYRIYMNYNGEIMQGLILSVLGNFQYYNLTQDKEIQKFADLSGNIEYSLADWSKVNTEASYRYQSGRGLGMNLLNLKLEYIVNILKIYMTFGVEAFYRNFIGTTSDFMSAYIRIERRF